MSLEHCIVPEIKKASQKGIEHVKNPYVVEFKVLALSGKEFGDEVVGKKVDLFREK